MESNSTPNLVSPTAKSLSALEDIPLIRQAHQSERSQGPPPAEELLKPTAPARAAALPALRRMGTP